MVELTRLVQNLVAGVSVGLVYGLMGLGVVFLWQSINRINFANISSAMLSVYLFFALHTFGGLPMGAAAVVAVLLVGVYGLGLRYFLYEPITKGGGARLEFVVATLMLTVFWLTAIISIFGGMPMRFPPLFGDATRLVRFFGIGVRAIYLYMIVAVVVLMIALRFLLRGTLIGKMLRATAQSRETAQLMGINVNVTTNIAFVMATTVVGIAGLLLGPIFHVNIQLGGGAIGIKGFAAAVMAGLTDPFGAILGGIVLGAMENFSTLFISSVYRDSISFAIIVIVLVARPKGIFNWSSKKE